MKHTICHIVTKLELGGAQFTTLFTVAHLDRVRFRPILITGEPGLLDDEARKIEGVEFYQVPSLVRLIRPWRDLRAFVELTRLLKSLRPAIVHTHSSKAGILGRWAAWLAGVPIIIHTIHGYGITPAQPRWLQFLLIGLERLTGLITTRWILVSEADAVKGLRWKLFRQGAFMVIRPGADTRVFQGSPLPISDSGKFRAECGVGSGHLLVGTVAPLKPQKAPQDFVAVAARVCARVPAARFVWVGDGELRPGVEAAIRRAGLEGRIRLAGWRRDIPDVMRAMDVFLLTSHWEGLPQVLLQARANCVPIVATRAGGSAEAFVEGKHGWLCDPGDIEALAAQVIRLLMDSAERERMRRNGGHIPNEFNMWAALRKREQLYAMLLAAQRHRVPNEVELRERTTD
ncbi:MAG: glycosyltransferase family 4 protein [Nitrospirae bacterium]|nr:MAG: glycosyltransferase family 4 protein [Nitrospirota bacterium]